MYIITVIPIKKGFQQEYLTYFSGTNIPLGSIVTIPIKFKNVDAIVVFVENAIDLKSDLKNRDYQLKKIIDIKGPSPFTPAFFKACEKMKEYTKGNLGSIIKTFLPSTFLENFSELKSPIINKKEQEVTVENIKHEKLIFQTLTPDRLACYRTLIREAFAKKESIFICVPTRYDNEKFKEELIKGIEQYVFCFHNELTKKVLVTTYNNAITENHPILIIGTGMFLSIPRTDLRTIILEHESSDAYKQFHRPYIDIRSFAEIFCSIENIKLIFGDTLLRPETLYRHENKELGEFSPPIFRLPQVDRQIVVDMKKENKDKKEKVKEFSILSKTTKDMIEYAISKNESIFLFSIRKGLAPMTICSDCNNVLLCPDCSTPIVLYGTKQRTATKTMTARIFMCNKCGKKENTEVRCPKCSSWNLTPLGIGTDRVYEEVKKLFPKTNIIQIDKESTPTDREAREAIQSFNKNPGSILIGTELVFSYLNTNIIHSAIISLDGLLSIPSFNITQKILHIIEKLNYTTKRNIIIQTRLPENEILRYVLSGNVLPLYREDLKERKQFGYPPFKRLIKITFTGTANETEKARILLEELLGKYEPQIFSAFVGKIKGQYITNTVIKIDRDLWPLLINDKKKSDEDLSLKLSLLPPSFSINIDPEDLL
jgi:primosomal protein N' (replication factor Y)